jgi:hypothetical protein
MTTFNSAITIPEPDTIIPDPAMTIPGSVMTIPVSEPSSGRGHDH